MTNEIDFETYLYISSKKIKIFVRNEFEQKDYYIKEFFLNDIEENENSVILDNFLKENIFKIEKIIDTFVKNITLIIEDKNLIDIKFSIKKENFENILISKNLNHSLNDLKNIFVENYKYYKIIHMVIEKYIIDNIEYVSFPKELNCNYFSLDVKFICLPDYFFKNFEDNLKKYQIKIKQVVSENYVNNFFNDDGTNIFSNVKKIQNGSNPNEILFLDKIQKNKGFFEKFFHFFS